MFFSDITGTCIYAHAILEDILVYTLLEMDDPGLSLNYHGVFSPIAGSSRVVNTPRLSSSIGCTLSQQTVVAYRQTSVSI